MLDYRPLNWTAPSHCPDDSIHKFDIACKDHSRQGDFGLKNYGGAVGTATSCSASQTSRPVPRDRDVRLDT